MDKREILAKNVAILSNIEEKEKNMRAKECRLPSIDAVKHIIELLRQIFFPGFFGAEINSQDSRMYRIGINVEQIAKELEEQISLSFNSFNGGKTVEEVEKITLQFLEKIPEIKRVLYTDIEAMYNSDPAVTSYGEIIFCYPIVQVMVHYREAHALLELKVPVLPRIITEMAHSATGIDIHPGAKIGEYFKLTMARAW